MVILESRNIDPGKDYAFHVYLLFRATLSFFLFSLAASVCKTLASASLLKKHCDSVGFLFASLRGKAASCRWLCPR